MLWGHPGGAVRPGWCGSRSPRRRPRGPAWSAGIRGPLRVTRSADRSGVNMVVSQTLPAVSSTTKARPRPSLSAWTFVASRLGSGRRHDRWAQAPRDHRSNGCPRRSTPSLPRLPAAVLIAVAVAAGGRGIAADPPSTGSVLVHPDQGGVRRDQPIQRPRGVCIGLRVGRQIGSGASGSAVGRRSAMARTARSAPARVVQSGKSGRSARSLAGDRATVHLAGRSRTAATAPFRLTPHRR
jgi:hypothetical protein